MKIYNRVKKYTSLFEPEIKFLTDIVSSAPEGDVVIAGTYKGGDAMSMILQDPMRDYHVVDSFEGLTVPVEEDNVEKNEENMETMISGEFSCGGLDQYIQNFKEAKILLPNCYEMFITEKTIKKVVPNKVAILWLDLDHFHPTKICLEYFDKFLVDGAILGCHDYGFIRCPGVKLACDSYSDKWEHAAGGIFSMKK